MSSESTTTADRMETGRLHHTRTLRGEGLARWNDAVVGIVGVGNIGWRLMLEAVLSGARVWLVDPDVGSLNSDTQFATAVVPKVFSAVAACDVVRSNHAVGVQADVRHMGIGEFSRLSVLIDCSDDPALAIPLTKISNGLGLPLVRVALDGSGERELGRVQCSHGGAGHACQLCTYSTADLFRYTRRTPCPVPSDARREEIRPTFASGALGSIGAGIGLLTAQRLVTGNDIEQTIDRELIFDLTGSQLLSLARLRSPRCVSGHVNWRLEHLDAWAATTTVAELFDAIEERVGFADFLVEPWLHSLCTEAACACGHWQIAVGTPWRTPPRCERCGESMHWFRQSAQAQVSRALADSQQLHDQSLIALGMPECGAMFVVHSLQQTVRHFVLR